ncbi:MAG: preprotein translocase subunit SecY [Clostridia bacterium]|nr:preprotein translocase subunit SecY [Clostridia bacterium]
MLEAIKNIFSVKDIRKKLIFTFLILLLFRVGSFITIPGLDKITINEQLGAGTSGFASMINLISGGAFSRLSIFSMTIGPYITASIVLNLLQFVIPSLERLAKEGEEGRKKLNKFTKYLTIAFAFIEGLGLYFTYKSYLLTKLSHGAGEVLGFLLFITSLIAGTSLLTWLGDKITEHGIGNGISMIVFFGIVAQLPTTISSFANLAGSGFTGILIFAALMIGLVLLIAGVVFVQNAERRIPVNYAKRVVGRKMYGGQSTHIPIKLAMAGVMPLIFAMSFMSFPSIIIGLVTDVNNLTGFWKVVYNLFTASSGSAWYYLLGYAVIYMVLIIAFTFIYTMFIVNPVEIANNLKKNGGFVPGIRAGKNTSEYINSVLVRITAAGSIFLAAIAILPIILQAFTNQSISFSGNSILILVSVGLEILRGLETQMVSRNYSGFLG